MNTPMETVARASRWPVPRLPVFGWHAWSGPALAGTPCLLDLPGCRFTTSGRASITLALQVLGVRAGQQVLLPTYHCPTMVAPAVQLGARPMFYPIDSQGVPRLDWLSVQDLTGVRVMLVAHYFGLPQPMARIRRWCDERRIALVEDCAHALFGCSDGRPIGTWGDIAVGSLTKFLPVPEGGCLVLNRGQPAPVLAPCRLRAQLKGMLDIIEEGARHGRLGIPSRAITVPLDALRALRRKTLIRRSGDEVHFANTLRAEFTIEMGLATRELSWGCRVLSQRLPRQRIVERRRKNYAELVEGLRQVADICPVSDKLPDGTAPYVLPLWVSEPDPAYQALRAERIPVFRWDVAWPDVPDLPGDAGKSWGHHIVQLACHQDLAADDVNRILSAMRRIFGRASP